MPVNLPEQFVSDMRAYFPGEADALFENIADGAPYRAVRANTLKIQPGGLSALLNITERVPWCADGFYINDGTRPAKSPFYHAGLFYIQEPSAMSAAAVLNPKPGDTVLDICAAPGGKTTQLASALKGAGLIVANDASASRCRALIKNIELMGITNAVVTSGMPRALSGRFRCFFDKILIDAPCSGEGMFRRDPDAVKNYTKHKPAQLSAIQSDILRYADIMLKPGGEMVYSTCTFSPQENEAVIGGFLDACPDYGLLPVNDNCGFAPGDPAFYKNGKLPQLKNTARLFPHKIKGEGFFIARLRKNAQGHTDAAGYSRAVNNRPYGKKRRGYADTETDFSEYGKTADNSAARKPPPSVIRLFRAFADAFINEPFLSAALKSEDYALFNNSLYLIPKSVPDLRGLRVLRAGLYLGDIKKDRFEPSQALAMSLSQADAKYTIDYSENDELLQRYLRGEDFAAPGGYPLGYCLILVRGWPVGFAKITGGKLKNKYPLSWVMT